MTLGGLYTWYHFSAMKTMVNTAHETREYYNQALQKLQASTPDASEAYKYLRSTAKQYAAFIPGASGYIDTAFNDLDAIRNKHGDEFDKVVKDAYSELREVSKGGANIQTAQKAVDVLQKHMERMYELGADAMEEIMNNHPEMKEKVGGNIQQLKQMGQQYGPEVQKQIDQTWDQVRDIMKSGVSADSVNKIKKLVEEKSQQVQQMGEQAWKKGMEQAKPYLDKNPEVKKMIENNADALRKGNAMELFNRAKQAVESGNTEDLQKYVNSTVDKVKSKGSQMGLDKYMDMIPHGSEIMPKLQQLREVAEKHSHEGEQLLKETMEEIRKVVSSKADKAQEIADKAKEESK